MKKLTTIKDYPNYTIDSTGIINNTITSINLKPSLSGNGYYVVRLKNNNTSKLFNLHRLIALHLIPNPENKPCVNHINGIKTDNNIPNLEWNTYSENNKHAYNNKLKIPYRREGIKNPSSKLNESKVIEIRNIGKSLTNKEIGIIYNVHSSLIHLILARKTWKHI